MGYYPEFATIFSTFLCRKNPIASGIASTIHSRDWIASQRGDAHPPEQERQMSSRAALSSVLFPQLHFANGTGNFALCALCAPRSPKF
jgi:hypothetical protein